MRISKQNRQLVKIAGAVNLLFLLLAVLFVLYIGIGHVGHGEDIKRMVKFAFANTVCWIINLTILVMLLPLFSARVLKIRWLSFYTLSFATTGMLGVLIANSFLYGYLSDEPIHSEILGPLFFVFGINTLSLVAIELILSRQQQSFFQLEYANMKTKNAELTMKSLEAEHEKLKNQLHPHFLFNSLSILKTLIRKDPELAEDYVVKLSGFLRFSISHNEQNVVPLGEELKFSLNYLEMQKIRFRDAIIYTLEVTAGDLAGAKLPVFSLQLVLENAVKHNRLTQEKPLAITIRYAESDWLIIENNIQPKIITDPRSGIGLKNLSDRYKLLIKEDIRIENDDSIFRVYLKIIRP